MTTTLVSFERKLTDEEVLLRTKYLLAQMLAGETDGIMTNCSRAGLENLTPGFLRAINFKTEAAANAYVAFCNTFDPAPVFTQILNFGEPQTWVNDLGIL